MKTNVFINSEGDMLGTYSELMAEYWNMVKDCTKKHDMEVLGCLVYEMEELQNYKDSKKKLLITFDSGNEFIIQEQ